MGKKRTRPTKTSKGQRNSVSRSSLVRRDAIQRAMDKLEAKQAGKKVATLISNPDTENSRKAPYIRAVF